MNSNFGKKLPGRRTLVWFLTLATVLASVVVSSARWIWFGELAASFSWHIGWSSLLAAAVLLALSARRHAVVAAALGVALVATEARLWFGAAPNTTSSASIQLVSANLLQPNRHHDDVAHALSATGADVIAVLELSKPMRAVLDRELASWPHRVYSPTTEWHASIWALALYSKLPLRETRWIPLRETYAPGIEVKVNCGAGELLLRLVHLPRPGQQWRVDARNQALEELAGGLAWNERSVLFGDLNTTSSSPFFAPLLERAGLRDSRAGFGRQSSWWLRSLRVPIGIAIDHVLVGRDVRVLEREIFEIPFSDHAGIRARLALERPTSSTF